MVQQGEGLRRVGRSPPLRQRRPGLVPRCKARRSRTVRPELYRVSVLGPELWGTTKHTLESLPHRSQSHLSDPVPSSSIPSSCTDPSLSSRALPLFSEDGPLSRRAGDPSVPSKTNNVTPRMTVNHPTPRSYVLLNVTSPVGREGWTLGAPFYHRRGRRRDSTKGSVRGR